MKIRYFGHSAFMISDERTSILLDPFINDNPHTHVNPSLLHPDYILVSHGHGDHLGDAVEIAKKSGAVIIAPYELGLYCSTKGANVHTMHIGGAYQFDFGRLKMTNALHGSSVIENHSFIYTGNPCGFIFEIGGRRVYFAGDTGLFGDMELLGKYENIDIAILPIGGNYTMDIEDALIALDMLKPDVVIPMHYNTFDVIKVDVDEFLTKAREKGIKAIKIEFDDEILI